MDRGAWQVTVRGIAELNMTEQLILSFSFRQELSYIPINNLQFTKLQNDSHRIRIW